MLNVGGEDICIKAGRHVAVVVPAELLDNDPPTDNPAQVSGEADITAGVLEGAASTLPDGGSEGRGGATFMGISRCFYGA